MFSKRTAYSRKKKNRKQDVKNECSLVFLAKRRKVSSVFNSYFWLFERQFWNRLHVDWKLLFIHKCVQNSVRPWHYVNELLETSTSVRYYLPNKVARYSNSVIACKKPLGNVLNNPFKGKRHTARCLREMGTDRNTVSCPIFSFERVIIKRSRRPPGEMCSYGTDERAIFQFNERQIIQSPESWSFKSSVRIFKRRSCC